MGIESFTSGIDRRKMLVAAAATVTGVAQAFPNVDAAVTPTAAQSLTAPPGTPALNVSAGIARRLSAIECRNQIRRDVGLPLLSIVKELKRMKHVEREEQFARFAAAHGDAVLDAILKRRREEIGDPTWTPRWAEAVAIGNRVRGVLLERFRAARRLG